MPLWEWTVLFALSALFWGWVARTGWPMWMSWLTARWDEEATRVFGWCMLIASTVWFVIGLIWPDFRL